VVELYKRKPNIKCDICGKLVYRRPCQLQTGSGRAFCSMACYGVSCRKEKPCVICGKPILRSLNRKTCSRSCSNKNRAGIKYGGRAPKDKVKSQQALKIRLLRDRGGKCERCGYDKYEILQVHHKNRDRNDNSIENLELICPNCHYEEHLLEKSWLKGFLEKQKTR
jgi:hypothetical protein